ncbi:hypothetical protein HYX02_05920 [Candidatus Woesearchaeota archaeon]|nr:hypothetical protein [Candidatus Woesearchaeota archaeon]
MIKAQNLIFEGEYYVPLDEKNLKESFEKIKNTLRNYLYVDGFVSQFGHFDIFGSSKFFTWRFHLVGEDIELPLNYKILKFFGNKEKIKNYQFQKWLQTRRLEIPFILELQIKVLKEGLGIIARSKPVSYIRLGQGSIRDTNINEQKYSYIESENCQFISDTMSAIHAREIKKPIAKSTQIKFGLSDGLRQLKLNELADLSDRAYSKINNNNIEDGLVDLRVILEKMLPELVKIIGINPEDQKIKSCLEILKSKGFIDTKMFNLIDGTLRNFLYSYLSDIPTHNREKNQLITERDANYIFHLFEHSLSYLLDKIQRRN